MLLRQLLYAVRPTAAGLKFMLAQVYGVVAVSAAAVSSYRAIERVRLLDEVDAAAVRVLLR